VLLDPSVGRALVPIDLDNRIGTMKVPPSAPRGPRFWSESCSELKFTQGRTAELHPELHVLGEEFLSSSLTPGFDAAWLAGSSRDRSDVSSARTDQSNPVAGAKRATHQIRDAAQLEECDEPEGGFSGQRAQAPVLPKEEGQESPACAGGEPGKRFSVQRKEFPRAALGPDHCSESRIKVCRRISSGAVTEDHERSREDRDRAEQVSVPSECGDNLG